HKQLQGVGFLGTVQSSITDVPNDPYTIDIGKANVVRPGDDVTIVGLGATVHLAMEAAKTLEAENGVSAEVIDLRSLVPLDRDTICTSVAKTKALAVVDDDYGSYGVSGEIIATVTDRVFDSLRVAPIRITYPDVPPPFSPALEQFTLPNAEKVSSQIAKAL
ncbi:MAG: transketolase C-terminal domain-containing protein, partial [Pseudomonadota bacterium]